MGGPSGQLVVVVGMHRSGTSAVAEAIARLGVDPGSESELMPGDKWNEKGYFEDVEVTSINEAILAELGGHWAAPASGADSEKTLSPDLVARMERCLERAVGGVDSHLWKDPRFSVVLPQWRLLQSRITVVMVWRHPAAVAKSLAARDKFPEEGARLLWEVYNRAAIANSTGLPRIVINYERLLGDPGNELKRLSDFLLQAGALSSPGDVGGAIEGLDRGLCHHPTANSEKLDRELPESQARLLAALERGDAGNPEYPITSPTVESVLGVLPLIGVLEIQALGREAASLRSALQAANEELSRRSAEIDRLKYFENSYNHIMSKGIVRFGRAVKNLFRWKQ